MFNKVRSVHLVHVRPSKKKYRVGERVPGSGIYRVFHSIHRVSHEVTLLQDEVFPPCMQCTDKVHFELVKVVPAIEEYDFRVRLYQIPHPVNKEEATKTA